MSTGEAQGESMATPISEDGHSLLPRLDVCFLFEDPVNFARRVGDAYLCVDVM